MAKATKKATEVQGNCSVQITVKGTVAAAQKSLGADWTCKGSQRKGCATAITPPFGLTKDFGVNAALLAKAKKAKIDEHDAILIVEFPERPDTGTLIKRSVRELGKLGIEPLEEDGDFRFTGDSGKLHLAAVVLLRMAMRAKRHVTITDHQLTWFDFAQAIGAEHAARKGNKDAKALMDWGNEVARAAAAAQAGELEAKRAAREAKRKESVAKKTGKPAGKVKAKSASLTPGSFKDEE
jgi:hypothetical protein